MTSGGAGLGAAAPGDAGTGIGASWASLLIQAAGQGRIDWSMLWDLLVTYADSAEAPDVASLLEHVVEPCLLGWEYRYALTAVQAAGGDGTPRVDGQCGSPAPAPAAASAAAADAVYLCDDDWFVLDGAQAVA